MFSSQSVLLLVIAVAFATASSLIGVFLLTTWCIEPHHYFEAAIGPLLWLPVLVLSAYGWRAVVGRNQVGVHNYLISLWWHVWLALAGSVTHLIYLERQYFSTWMGEPLTVTPRNSACFVLPVEPRTVLPVLLACALAVQFRNVAAAFDFLAGLANPLYYHSDLKRRMEAKLLHE